MANLLDLSCYEPKNGDDYSDLSLLEPTLIINSHPLLNDLALSSSSPSVTPSTTYRQHSSPNGSAGQASVQSEESFEEQPPPFAMYPSFYQPYYAAPHYYYGSATPHPSQAPMTPLSTSQMPTSSRNLPPTGKKRKCKKDPNEPNKPVSAYALFFRDTQAAIKGQKPNASFGEVSKIVAGLWDNLDTDKKNIYKQRTEQAKKEYLKQLAAYRANLISSNGPIDAMTRSHANFLSAAQQLNSPTNTMSPSTTSCSTQDASTRMKAEAAACGGLAALIAAPAPQRTLTATTTLTVPNGSHNFQQQGEQFRPSDSLKQRCRDVFSLWGEPEAKRVKNEE